MTAAASSPRRSARSAPDTGPALDLARNRDVVTVAAATSATVLALSSTGSMVVAAVLLGVATADRRSGLALVGAVAAVSVRFATATFDDVAGIQSVLGSAGVVGPATGAASAWLAAAAVLVATTRPSRREPDGGVVPVPSVVVRASLALAAGALAAAIVAGPGPGGGIGVRVLATVAATAVAAGLASLDRRPALTRHRPSAAVLLAAIALVLAAWPA